MRGMLTRGAVIGAALLFGAMAGPHLDAPARAQTPGDEEESPTVEELLGTLIQETRGLRGDMTGSASGGGGGGLGSDVRAIRDALERRQRLRVVQLPHDADGSLASADAQERALAGVVGEGYRLIAVSEGFAYFGKR